jgi:hypothetical protein
MGNEPEDGETHEVTVELDGPVSKEAFDEYKRRLRECLDRLNQLTDAKMGDKKLKVRWLRGGIVPKPPHS